MIVTQNQQKYVFNVIYQIWAAYTQNKFLDYSPMQ